MRRVASDQIEEGMVLARPVQDANRHTLLAAGARLGRAAVARIGDLDCDCVYVDDPRFRGLELEDEVPPRLLAQAVGLFREWARQAEAGGRLEIDPGPVGRLIRDLEDELDPGSPLTLIPPRGESRYLAVQAVNGARLCLAAAPKAAGSVHAGDAALAAFVRDVGMLTVPADLRRRPAPLEDAERARVQQHVAATLEALQHPGWTAFVKVAAGQHHERLDGSGYPSGAQGEDLHRLGTLLAVVDTYCALVAPRPYRPPMRPEEALEMLLGLANWQFAADAVRALAECVGLYRPGAVVHLSTGQQAIVTHAGRGMHERPRVRALDGGGQLDLGRPENLTVQILAVLED